VYKERNDKAYWGGGGGKKKKKICCSGGGGKMGILKELAFKISLEKKIPRKMSPPPPVFLKRCSGCNVGKVRDAHSVSAGWVLNFLSFVYRGRLLHGSTM